METGTKKIVGLDGDNTLWDWLGYAVPAYEAMSEAIAELAGKTVPETRPAMKAFYSSVGSIEHEGLVQGLYAAGFFNGVRDFDEAETIRVAMSTFERVQRENLALYPEVDETLAAIRSMGHELMLVSDAPIHKARARLEDLGILDRFSYTFGMASPNVSRRPPSKRVRPAIRPDMIFTQEKPFSASELAQALGLTRAQLAERMALFAGDSEPKDMGYALNIGCPGAHTLWGMAKPKLVERIQAFAPPNVTKRHMQVAEGNRPATSSRIITLRRPREILDLLGV